MLILSSSAAVNGQFAFSIDEPQLFTGLDANGLSIARDPAGNLYIVGIFEGSIDIDPGPDQTVLTSAGIDPIGASDTFVASYTPTGALRWGFSYGMMLWTPLGELLPTARAMST